MSSYGVSEGETTREVEPSAFAAPKPASVEEIEWVRHLLRGERNLAMLAASLRPLYSAFDDQTNPPRFLWRSFVTTRRSWYIASFAGEESTDGRAPVEILLYDSKSPDVSVSFEALARRVPQDLVPGALAVYTEVRTGREEKTDPNRPEPFYEATVTKATVPVPIFEPDGTHTGESHTEISLQSLTHLHAS